jgi:hypothetical protein
MRRLLVTAAATAACVACLGAGEARAQYTMGRPPGPLPVASPVYSPYLNLLRPNASLVQNYYGLVRPELEFRSAVYGLQQDLVAVGQASAPVAVDPTTGLPYTGHATRFLNTSHYFLNRGGQGVPAPPAPAAAAAAAAPPRAAR